MFSRSHVLVNDNLEPTVPVVAHEEGYKTDVAEREARQHRHATQAHELQQPSNDDLLEHFNMLPRAGGAHDFAAPGAKVVTTKLHSYTSCSTVLFFATKARV